MWRLQSTLLLSQVHGVCQSTRGFDHSTSFRDCQKQHWKAHKAECKDWAELERAGIDLADQEVNLKVHSREFKRIVSMHGLNKGKKADQLADLLTDTSNDQVSPDTVAARFNIPRHDASTLLSWIDIGLRFKEQALDAANKS